MFDAIGRPGVWRDMVYGYDASSNRTSIVWHDGFNVAYQYDGADRMTRAAWAGGSSNFAHDVMSRPVEQTRENSYGTGYGWRASDDLETLVHHGLGTLTHGYNAAGQVTARTSTAPAFEWTPPPGYGRDYGAANPQNQVSSEAGAPIVFDQSGAMTSDGATTYVYDLADRLVSASGPLGTGAYLYDAQGRRDRRTINGTFTLHTQWSGEEEVAEYDADLTIRYRFVPGPGVDRKVAVVGVSGAPETAQPTRYLHADAQGSVLAATTETGLIPRLTAYSPWGEVSGTPPDAFSGMAWGYAGRPHDPETGLVYVRARYYSPRLGQWLTPDPIGTEDDPNLYQYVGLDPVNAADPSGACQECAFPNFRTHDEGDALDRAVQEALTEPFHAAGRIVADLRARRQPSLGDVLTVAGAVPLRGRGSVAAQVIDKADDAARATGIVYLRRNRVTGTCYVGRCSTYDRFIARQGEHRRRDRSASYDYEILEQGLPLGMQLRQAEQRNILARGGPRTRDYPNATLENRRNEIRQIRPHPNCSGWRTCR